jgi:hypothetical protein
METPTKVDDSFPKAAYEKGKKVTFLPCNTTVIEQRV